jgi:hypothetical protein
MSIEKKSLISNRIASKKAIVTKPEGSKVASNKTIMARSAAISKVIAHSPKVIARVASPRVIVHNRIKVN